MANDDTENFMILHRKTMELCMKAINICEKRLNDSLSAVDLKNILSTMRDAWELSSIQIRVDFEAIEDDESEGGGEAFPVDDDEFDGEELDDDDDDDDDNEGPL